MLFVALGSLLSPESVQQSFGCIYDGNGTGTYASLQIGSIGLQQYYQALLGNPQFWYNFWNSVLLTVPILAGTLFVGTLGAYGFAKFHFPCKNILFFLFIVVMMLPYQVTLVPNFVVSSNLGLIGSRWSLILPNLFTPFGTFLVYQFMRGIPDETLEMARIEGAGSFRVLTRIVIPQALPGITSLAILNIIDTWSMIEQPLVFLRDETKYPLSVAMQSINRSDIGVAFVCGTVFMIPLMLVFLIGKDYLSEGVSNSVL